MHLALIAFTLLVLLPSALLFRVPLRRFLSAVTEPTTIAFATSSSNVNENAGTFSVTVNLSLASPVDTTIPFTVGGTAVAAVTITPSMPHCA